MTSKLNALATCLFEAIDDVNFSNIIVLLEKHGADPNTIISKLNIAPIHYAVGFDDENFADKVTSLFLKKKGNPNLPSDGDKLTPLHIACIWGRSEIVKQLLEHGGDLDLKCNEGQTPISYAIHENNFQTIETIQKFVFEQKIDKKRKELILKSKNLEVVSSLSTPTKKNEGFSTPVKNNHLKNALESLDDKKFTPNRINYNFDATSPYFINITHRRHKTSRENSLALEDENQTEAQGLQPRNLFELTKRNLKEFSHQMSPVMVIDRLAIHKRRSYIKTWREKIQQIRKSNTELDIGYINYLNSCNNVTLMKGEDPITVITSDESDAETIHSSNDSFTTAKSGLQRFENAIRAPEPEVIEHFEEDYVHNDRDNGVILFERKIISKSKADLNANEDDYHDDARSQSSVSTKVTLPPLDYDTDALRTELTELTGGAPGPITKNTKKLYLKQLVKLKKRPDLIQDKRLQKYYSMELQRTIKDFEFLEQNLSEFHKLEAQMAKHINDQSNIKWREGNMKTSFIYLLIDPRESDNLPLQYKDMTMKDVWIQFLSSIFYVGKGKRSRPYCHLYDAIKLFSVENNQIAERLENRRNQVIEKRVIYSNALSKKELLNGKKTSPKLNVNKLQESEKLKKIVDIWKAQQGVVCLHVFNNIMPCEAYTREASIIDALGLENLTNMKKGDYYGAARTFSMRQKKQMGIGLLHRACSVYLAEGESQLMPFDLI